MYLHHVGAAREPRYYAGASRDVGPPVERALDGLPPAPAFDCLRVSVQQDFRHSLSAPLRGARVVRRVEHPAVKGIFFNGAFAAHYARDEARYGVYYRHRGHLAARQHEIAEGYFHIHILFREALVHALIVAADDDEALFAREVFHKLLMEAHPLRARVDDVGLCAAGDRFDRLCERLRHEHHAAAAVAVVVYLPVRAFRKVADVHDFRFELPRRYPAPEHARSEVVAHQLWKGRDDGYLHLSPTIPLEYSLSWCLPPHRPILSRRLSREPAFPCRRGFSRRRRRCCPFG